MATFYRYAGATNPETYEWENLIADQPRHIERFMGSLVPFDEGVIVDIGAGSAFHAARFAESAHRVYAVEPDLDMLAQAFSRLSVNPRANVGIVPAGADDIPLRDNIADIVHARFAYFFGPEGNGVASCEPGIREAMRMLKPGRVFVVIDNNLEGGDFACFLARYGFASAPSGSDEQRKRDAFWHVQGFEKQTIASSWSAPDRDILRQVVSMEFPAGNVDALLAEVEGTSFSYYYDVYYRFKR